MRIQILLLPSVVKGDDVEEPFALVIDQCESGLLNPRDDEMWQRFRDDLGARACLVVPYTVEIVDRYAEPAKDDGLDEIRERAAREIERHRMVD